MDKKLALRIQFFALDKLSGSMKKIVGLGEKGGQVIARLKREARDLDRQMTDVRGRLGAAPFNTGLIQQEAELRKALGATNRELEKRKRFLQMDNRVGTMRAQGDALIASGQSNMIGGASMLAPFVLATKGAMDFSSGMVDLQQKAELTNAEMFKMRQSILLASAATHQLPEDMRSAVDVLAGFGMDPRDAAKLAAPIGKLGTAFKVDLADGASAAYANINNLKIGLNETGKAFDIMAAGGNAGAFEIKDMARWFPKLTAQAQALGQHGTAAVADLTAALQIARRGAGSADEAANNVSNLLQKINAPGTIRAFQKNFGIDLPAAMEEAYRKGKTPMEAIAQITNKALGGNLKNIGFAFEDAQAQSALRKLIQDMADYKKMRGDIAKANGTVQGAFSQRELNDGMVSWNKFKVQMTTTALVLGDKLLPVASEFLTIAGGMAQKVGDFAQANPQLTSTLLHLVAGMGAAKLGLGALQFAFGGILKPAATAWGIYSKWKEAGSVVKAFPVAAKAFSTLRNASIVMAKGFMRAGLMMLANPMILAIVALVAVIGVAGYLIYKHWDTIKAAFDTGIAALGRAWDWLKGTFSKFPWLFGPLGLAVAFVTKHWDAISGAFNSGIATVKDFFSGLPGWMKTIGLQMMTGLVSALNPALLTAKLLSVARSGVTAFKDYFGIKSPSRLFMQMGGHLTEGLARGVERGERRPVSAVTRMAAGVAGAVALGTSPAAAAPGGGNGGALAAGGVQIGRIEIHQQPGEDADQLVKRVVDEIERRAAAARRGSYRDHG